jgi:hypothetical protein
MVKAKITIGTCYGDADIPVEVLGKGPRPGTAWVRALDGLEPFTKNSHGGPYQDNTSIVLIPHLRDIQIESDPVEELIEEPAQENEIKVQLPVPNQSISSDWFLESAYTVCAQPPEGGEA